MTRIPDLPISAWTFLASTLLTGYVLFVGTYALLAPASYASCAMRGIVRNLEEDAFDCSLLQSIGGIIVGFAAHVYLVLAITLPGGGDGGDDDARGALSLERAMGYALLPRILLILWSVLRARLREGGEDFQFEHTRFLKVNFVVMSYTALSLLTGVGNPTMSTKVFSAMALVKAAALVIRPVEMTQKIFGVNVSEEDMAQSCFLSSTLGYYLGLHAILMGSLAYGVDPNLAVWTSALVWIAISVWVRVVLVGRIGHMRVGDGGSERATSAAKLGE